MFRFPLKYLQHGVQLCRQPLRTFLSDAYYCRDVWQSRLSSPILQKINPDILYHELDQRFQKSREISAVDVDVFTNSLHDALFIDEALDLVHKLRLSGEASNAHESTTHAVIRLLLDQGRLKDLLLALDDRLNYGLFLDSYTTNILFDYCWKNKDYTSGAFVAGQVMLQEDVEDPANIAFGLAHCYNYLVNPSSDWPQAPKPEEPEEEIKVRVQFVRNPYDDQHFDLKDPKKIVGKTLVAFSKTDSALDNSFRLLGLALTGNKDKFERTAAESTKKNIDLVKNVLDLVPDDFKETVSTLKLVDWDGDKLKDTLESNIKETVAKQSERDIGTQCKLYGIWEEQRIKSLEAQRKRLDVMNRLKEIDRIQEELRQKEQKLWFFENEESIELAIEEAEQQQQQESQHQFKEKKKAVAAKDEEYIPPEVTSRV